MMYNERGFGYSESFGFEDRPAVPPAPDDPIIIVTQPVPLRLYYEGEEFTLSVVALNVTNYAWQYSDDNGDSWFLAGSNMADLNLVADDSLPPGRLFRCILRNRTNTVITNTSLVTGYAPLLDADAIWFDADTHRYSQITGASATSFVDTEGLPVGSWWSADGTKFGAAPALDRRPILRKDWFNGRDWLEFDGLNDCINLTASLAGLLNNVPYVYIFATVASAFEASRGNIFHISTDTAADTTRASVVANSNSSGGASAGLWAISGRRLAGETIAGAQSSQMMANNEPTLISGEFLYGQAKAVLWVNDKKVATNLSFQTAGNTAALDSLGVFIGDRSSAVTTEPFDGFIRGLLICTPSEPYTEVQLRKRRYFMLNHAGMARNEVLSEVRQDVTPSTNTTFSIPASFAPKLWNTANVASTAVTTASTSSVFSNGAATPTLARSVGIRGQSGVATTQETRRHTTSPSFYIDNAGTGASNVLTATFDGTDIDLSLSGSVGFATYLNSLLLGGDGEYKIIEVTTPQSSGVQTIAHGLDGIPTFIRAYSVGISAAPDSFSNDVIHSEGVWASNGNQFCITNTSLHNVAGSVCKRRSSTSAIAMTSLDFVSDVTAVSDVDETNIYLQHTKGDTTQRRIFLVIGAGVAAQVDYIDHESGADTRTVYTPLINPTAGFCLLSPNAITHVGVTQNDCSFSLGFFDSAVSCCVGYTERDAVASTLARRFQDNDEIRIYDTGGTSQANARVSLGNTKVDFVWSAKTAAYVQGAVLTIGQAVEAPVHQDLDDSLDAYDFDLIRAPGVRYTNRVYPVARFVRTADGEERDFWAPSSTGLVDVDEVAEWCNWNLVKNGDVGTGDRWASSNITVTPYAAAAPDGSQTAIKLESTSTFSSWLSYFQPETGRTSVPVHLSFYIKQGSGTWGNVGGYFRVRNNVTTQLAIEFRIHPTTGVISDNNAGTVTVSDAGNGWWYVQAQGVISFSAGNEVAAYLGWSGATGTAGLFNYIWHPQVTLQQAKPYLLNSKGVSNVQLRAVFDSSGRGMHDVQHTSTRRPIVCEQGVPVVDDAGILVAKYDETLLQHTKIPNSPGQFNYLHTTGGSVIAVTKSLDTAGTKRIFDNKFGGSTTAGILIQRNTNENLAVQVGRENIGGVATSNNTSTINWISPAPLASSILSVATDPDNSTPYLRILAHENGIQNTVFNTLATTPFVENHGQVSIGGVASGISTFSGWIGAVMIAENLTVAQRLQVEEILAEKHNISIDHSIIVTTQPESAPVKVVNETLYLSVVASNVVTYQWQYSDDGTTWVNTGTNSKDYSALVTPEMDGRQFRCILTNYSDSETTITSTLTAIDPGIVTHPAALTSVLDGDPVSLSCEYNGSTPLYAHWEYSDDSGQTWTSDVVAVYLTPDASGVEGEQLTLFVDAEGSYDPDVTFIWQIENEDGTWTTLETE